MGTSDWAAWYGAVVSSLVLFWDIYRHFTSGPRLKIVASPGSNTHSLYIGMQKLVFNVYNKGDAPAKIGSIEIDLEGTRFPAVQLSQEFRFSPFEVIVQGHEEIILSCREFGKRKYEPGKPSLALVRISYLERPLAVKVPAFDVAGLNATTAAR